MRDQSILWRTLDWPGHEFMNLFFSDPKWHLSGIAVFAHNQQPCKLEYLILCNSKWRTLSGKITGQIGNVAVEIEIWVDSKGRWRFNGTECPEVEGCTDIDLGFSPSTNLLPIRRLGLAVGQEAEVRAAWLRFPSFTLQPLEQKYRRLDDAVYRYESARGSFVTELKVNADGVVIEYPKYWEAEVLPSYHLG